MNKTIQFDKLHWDDQYIYAIQEHSNGILLNVLSPDLDFIHHLDISGKVHKQLDIQTDAVHIYVPLYNGQILVIDKQNGKKKNTLNLGYAVPVSNVLIQDNHAYVLCGTPIMNQWHANTQTFSLIGCNIQTGRRSFQSCAFSKNCSSIAIHNGRIYFASGSLLNQLSLECELLQHIKIGLFPHFPLIADEDCFILCAKNGLVEVLSSNFKSKYVLKIAESINGYYFYEGLHLFDENKVLLLNSRSGKTLEVFASKSKITSLYLDSKQICIGTEKGDVEILDKNKWSVHENNDPIRYIFSLANRVYYINGLQINYWNI